MGGAGLKGWGQGGEGLEVGNDDGQKPGDD